MKMKNETLKQGYCKSSLKQIHSRVSFSFLPKGGQNEDYWGQAHIHVQSMWQTKGSKGLLPRGSFDFGPGTVSAQA